MSGKKTSTTTYKSDIFDQLLGDGGHYETTISDGSRSVSDVGKTAEIAESDASAKWDRKYGDDD